MISKVCLQCNKPFLTDYSGTKFCSRKCVALSMSRKIQICCPTCKKIVYVHKGIKFCSKKCADDARRGVRISPVVIKICPVCNKSFESKYKSHTFCSRECGNIGRKPAVHAPLTKEQREERRERLKLQWQNDNFRKLVVNRMKTNNPVHMPGVVEKANISRSKHTIANNFKYGNGKISPYEQLVKDKLEPFGFVYNYAIPTKPARDANPDAHYPNNYKPDFVNLEDKLCIEIDGAGHSSPKDKIIDAKKEKCLNFLGYSVIRFTHNDIDEGEFDKWLSSYQKTM